MGRRREADSTIYSTSVRLTLVPALLYPSPITRLRYDERTAVGILSPLNDYRISVGLGPFGWINPWLYGVGSFGFNDITSGHNPSCGTEGFEATDGWDPVRPARLLSLRFRLC